MYVYYKREPGKEADYIKHVEEAAKETRNSNIIGEIGLFSGALDISEVKKYKRPVLVASTDGVGTKLKIAASVRDFTLCGMDIVNHCLNDIVCSGAKPLAFLDYIASERLEVEAIEQIMRGISLACRNEDVPLIGGETAEMPGFYNLGEYEVVGFAIGVVEEERMITGRGIKPGDVLIGLASNGLHTNGYTMIRKIFFETEDVCGGARRAIEEHIPQLDAKLYEELLKPHKCYTRPVRALLNAIKINGIAHITGGGIGENLLRILPEGCSAHIVKSTWQTPEIFRFIQEEGEVSEKEMFDTFNMGVGMILVIPPDYKNAALKFLNEELGCEAYVIGSITKSDDSSKKVVIV